MKTQLFVWLMSLAVFAGFANTALADPVINVPDPWYVGQSQNIEGGGFPSYASLDFEIEFADESTDGEGILTNSVGDIYPDTFRIDPEAPGGTAIVRVYQGSTVLASKTIEVVSAPTLFVSDPLDVSSTYEIEGWGFAAYDGEDIYISAMQGQYRMIIDDDRPNMWGYISTLQSGLHDDDWFASEATIVASLEDGTILATVTVDIANGTGSEPVFESEFEPYITVTPPTTFREGDSFDVDLINGIAESSVYVQVIGDNNTVEYDYGSYTTDQSGELSISVRMPLVLGQGIAQDGRTIRVIHGGYSEDFSVTLNEGVRLGLSVDTFQEGDVVQAEVRNGTGQSQVIFQIVHDNEKVVHEFGYLQTDGSGYGQYNLTIPTVLDPEYTVDNFTFRMIHAGLIIDKSVTITEGLRMYVGAQNVREGHNLNVAVYNGTPSTSVSIDWWLDTTFVQSQPGSFATNGSGDGEFTITVPDVLHSAAESDRFTLRVTHDGNTFELGVTVYQSQTPDPGSSQATGLSNGNKQSSVEFDSIIGLAQLYNLGYSIDDIYQLVDEDFAFDPNFPRVLGYAANSIKYGKPLDEISLATLLGSMEYANFDDFDSLPVSDDPRAGLKERTKQQLVILIHGMGATSADDPEDAGMNKVYNMLVDNVAPGHIIRLRSGNIDGALDPADAYLDAISDIKALITILEASGPDIKSVVIAGHSWGGGMAKHIADWVNGYYGGSIEVSGLVYVDAVWPYTFGSVDAFPSNVSSLLNIFQTDHNEFSDLANGISISNPGLAGFDGTAYYGRYREYDVDADGDNASHTTIDQKYAGDVADFIEHVLDEWYWSDLALNNL